MPKGIWHLLPKGTAEKGQAANACGHDELTYFGIGLITHTLLSVPLSPYLMPHIHMVHLSDGWSCKQVKHRYKHRKTKELYILAGKRKSLP